MRCALFLVAVLVVPAVAQAQAPAYQRMRHGADDWQARGGRQNWRGGHGYGGYFDSYFFAPPIVAGSWYERPYPYHFDYYRHRWGGAGQVQQGEMMPVADCPCLQTPPPVEAVE